MNDHWHVAIGQPNVAEFIFMDAHNGAVKFFDVSDMLMGKNIDKQSRVDSEAMLYQAIDEDLLDPGSGIYMNYGPFVTFFYRCNEECRKACLN